MSQEPTINPVFMVVDDALLTLAAQSQALGGLERLLVDSGTIERQQFAMLLALIRAKVQGVHDALSALEYAKSA